MRALGRAEIEKVEAMPYLALQQVDDSVGGHSYRRYWKGHYFAALPTRHWRHCCCAAPPTATVTTCLRSRCRPTAARSRTSPMPTAHSASATRSSSTSPAAGGTIRPRTTCGWRWRGMCCRARPLRQRRVRQHVGPRGRGGRAPCLPDREAGPVDRAQGPVRPGERLPPQPEHPAERLVSAPRLRGTFRTRAANTLDPPGAEVIE